MTVAIIAHVEEDHAYVEALTRALPSVRFVVCALDPAGPPLAFDPRLPLVLVWSERAARTRATRAFAALIRTHGGESILCAADRNSPPKEFDRLACAKVDGAQGSAFFPGGLAAAINAAVRRADGMAEAPQTAGFSPGAFAGGLAKGIAGGAALFGAAAGVPLVMDAIAVQHASQPVDESFSVMDVAGTVGDEAAPFDRAPEAVPYPAGFATGEPPEELVRLAQRVLNEADVPLASTARAEQVARKVHQAFGEQQLRALEQVNEIWLPDPGVTEPLENFAEAPVLELTDEIGPEEELWDGPASDTFAPDGLMSDGFMADGPISTSSVRSARVLA